MKKFKIILGAVALAMGVGSASAATLGELFGGGSITVGDKLFSDWSLVRYDSNDGSSFDPLNIDVTGLADNGTQGLGLNFSVINGQLNVTGDGGYAYRDLMFGFSVTVLDPTMWITGNTLSLGTAFVSSNTDLGLAGPNVDVGSYIIENLDRTAVLLDPAATGDLSTTSIEFSYLAGVDTSKSLDSAIFAGQNKIWVTKNILVWAAEATDSAGLFGFQQRFLQETIDVPEPATITLLGLGFAGLAFRRRKLDA